MHEDFMLAAIEQSKNGFPAPNPRVGCVIVKEGQIVGRGFCAHDGADHAEVIALRDAGQLAEGATAYVTLEPCNHFGRTPPCSHALVKAGIVHVVIATLEENPVAVAGVDYLSDNGVFVESTVLARKAAEVNAQFLFAMRHRRPMVTVKAGMTLDGKIALPSGESKWITSEASRLDAMRLRAECGCVLVGRTTAEQDKARLTVRGIDVANQPLRVVVDPRDVLDQSMPIFDGSAPTLHLTNSGQPFSAEEILQRIWDQKQIGILIEGGPTTAARFFEEGLVDQIVLYIAPKVFGEGKSWVGTFGLSDLSSSPSFELAETRVIDGDIKLTYRSRNLAQFIASYNM